MTALGLEGDFHGDVEPIAGVKIGAAEAHRDGSIARHAPIVEVVGDSLTVDERRPRDARDSGAVDHQLIVWLPARRNIVANPVPGPCHVSHAGSRQLDAIGVGSIGQRDGTGAIRRRWARQQLIEACPAEWGVDGRGSAEARAVEAGLHPFAVSTGTDKTMIKVMSSAAPVTAKRRFMIRNTLVIDQTQFASLVDGGSLGVHMQLAIDAFDVSFDRVPRQLQQPGDLIIAVAFGAHRQHRLFLRR